MSAVLAHAPRSKSLGSRPAKHPSRILVPKGLRERCFEARPSRWARREVRGQEWTDTNIRPNWAYLRQRLQSGQGQGGKRSGHNGSGDTKPLVAVAARRQGIVPIGASEGDCTVASVPRPPTNNATAPRRRPRRVSTGGRSQVARVPVVAPLPHIARHVIEPHPIYCLFRRIAPPGLVHPTQPPLVLHQFARAQFGSSFPHG